MESTLEHKIADFVALWCVEKGNLPENQRNVITYGIEVFLSNIWKFSLFLFFGIRFDFIYEIVVTLLCFSIMRYFAGGRHQKTSLGCFLSMAIICFVSILSAKYITILTPLIIIGIMGLNYLIINRYSPYISMVNICFYDRKIIKEKNKQARFLILIFIIIILFIQDLQTQVLMITAISCESLTILPKILRKEVS